LVPYLTAVHHYGSFENLHELKPNSGRARWNPRSEQKRKILMQEGHAERRKNGSAPQSKPSAEPTMAEGSRFEARTSKNEATLLSV
jgi:hypothetical protein